VFGIIGTINGQVHIVFFFELAAAMRLVAFAYLKYLLSNRSQVGTMGTLASKDKKKE
jgi:hypothetical protein